MIIITYKLCIEPIDCTISCELCLTINKTLTRLSGQSGCPDQAASAAAEDGGPVGQGQHGHDLEQDPLIPIPQNRQRR